MLGVFLRHDPEDFDLPRRRFAPPPESKMRTGLSDALATDAADDSYDLAWMTGLPSDDIRAIPYLRKLLAHEKDLLDRHFMFVQLETILYRCRSAFTSALGEYDEACRQHDAEMDGVRQACLAVWRSAATSITPLCVIWKKKSQGAHRFLNIVVTFCRPAARLGKGSPISQAPSSANRSPNALKSRRFTASENRAVRSRMSASIARRSMVCSKLEFISLASAFVVRADGASRPRARACSTAWVWLRAPRDHGLAAPGSCLRRLQGSGRFFQGDTSDWRGGGACVGGGICHPFEE